MTPEWTLDTSCRKVTLGAAGTSAAAQWSWWNFRGYHHDATLVMAMTVTITMSITVKAIVKIVTCAEIQFTGMAFVLWTL